VSYRLPDGAHTSRPWRIHEIAPDFRVEDVWALPGRGGPEDFPRLVKVISTLDPERQSSSWAVRGLFALRWKVGGLLGWDHEGGGIGKRVATLRDRLPADLRERPGPDHETLPFTPLYLTEDEYAAEVANETMHGILHLGAVPDGDGFTAQMAVLVKPNGFFGRAYMAAIAPFRHLIVYPVLLRDGAAAWEAELARDTRDRAPAGV
jgi:Protein of unknown function (DUF2867)